MLKIKFNINEFKIIFLRRFEGKNERKRISFSLYRLQCPLSCFLVSFLLQPPFLLQRLFFFSVSALFFLLQRPFFFSLVPHFFFSLDVLPFFFSPKYFFNPKRFSTQDTFSAQNVFQPKNLSLFVVQRLLLFFFSFCFSVFSFSWFCFQCLLLFLFSPPFCFFSSCLSFLFSSHVALFFKPKNIFFSPKQFFSFVRASSFI